MSCSVLEKLNELNLTSDFVESNIQLKEQARSVVCVKVGNFLLPLGPCHAGRLAVLFCSICVRVLQAGDVDYGSAHSFEKSQWWGATFVVYCTVLG